jgi:hypothetical protein
MLNGTSFFSRGEINLKKSAKMLQLFYQYDSHKQSAIDGGKKPAPHVSHTQRAKTKTELQSVWRSISSFT